MRIPTGERRFSCNFCEKSFTELNILTSHMLHHTTGTTFSCSICHQKFAHMGALRVHLLRHRGEVRNKSFTNSCSLERPACSNCETCNIQFADPNEFQRHLLLHQGEWPFRCVVTRENDLAVKNTVIDTMNY